MSVWKGFSQLSVVGSEIFKDPIFSEISKSVNSSINIIYVEDMDTLKKRKELPKVDTDLPEAILLSQFPAPRVIKSLQSLFPDARFYGLPGLYSICFKMEKWIKHRPIFSFAMKKVVIAFTGLSNSEQINLLASYVNWMGGSVRRKLDPDVTHLIAYRCAGDKVRAATRSSSGVTVMRTSWITSSWELCQQDYTFDACDSEFLEKHRARVFQECYLYFIGFTSNSSTLAELKRVVSEHGGSIADGLHDLRLTHVIVADDWQKLAESIDMSGLVVKPSELQDFAQKTRRSSSVAIDLEMRAQITDVAYRVPVLRLDWFWKSLQSTVLCRARDYLYVPELQANHETPSNSSFSVSRTLSHQYASYDALSPQSAAFEKENAHPNSTRFDSFLSPRNSADLSDVRMRHSTSLQQMSREEVIAQLADPLISPSGRRLSRNANSFGLSPPSLATHVTSTPATGRDKTSEEEQSQELEKSMPLSRTPLGELKASSSSVKRTSPAKVNAVDIAVENVKAVTTDAAQEAEDREKALSCRQHRVLELIVTERNYFNVVKFLSQTAYTEVMDEQQDGGAILPRAEADRLFAKLNPIYQLHGRIMPQLEELERTFDPATSCLGEIFLPYLDDMERVYNHYMQTYDSSHVTELSTRYPRFLAYMRNVERNSVMGRQGLADLLVRPVQRLPSMLLLLQGIEKFTPKSHPDYWGVSMFTKKLDGLLKSINDRMKQNDEYINLLRLFHEISGAPPELLSASRSMVIELNVFLLDQRVGKMPVCEPVTIFLMTDCLEIVRPKKQNTSDSHAIQATVAALESMNTATSSSGHATNDGSTAKAIALAITCPEPVVKKSQPAGVSRTGSGASSSAAAAAVASTTVSKKRHRFTHVNLIKLQDIKRVLDLSTPSPERAAFSLIVREATDNFDQMLTFALAASATATAAVVSGKYPEAIQSKIAKVERGASSNSIKRETKPELTATGVEHGSETALERLQHCVHEAKTSFLQRLCQHIMQVSFVNTKVEDLLVEMEPEVVLDFDLNRVFSLLSSGAYKPKKFTRQLGRAISMKTPRRPPYLWQKPHITTSQQSQQQQQQSHQGGVGGAPLQPATSSISLVSTGGGDGGTTESYTPSRHSVLGSIFGGIASHTTKPSPSFKSSTRSIHGLLGDDSSHRSDISPAVLAGDATPTADMAHAPSQFSLTGAVQHKRGTAGADNFWLELVSTSDDEEISDDDDSLNVSVTDSVCNATAANTGGEPDTLSIGSFNSSSGVGGGGLWPAYFPMVVSKKKVVPRDPARSSAASLRSASLSMKGDSMSLGTCAASSGHGRQSFGGLMNATRKSICRSFLAGIRKPSKAPSDQLMPPPPTPPLPQVAPSHPSTTPSQQHQTSVPATSELSVHASSFVGTYRAPLALPDDDLEAGDDSRTPSSTAIPRSSSSTVPSTVVGVPRIPALDRSASECNLSLDGGKKHCSTGVPKTPLAGHRVASGLMRLPGVTSSASSLRNLFTVAASPFRVPSAVPPRSAAAQLAPPGAVSMVAAAAAAATTTISSSPPVHATSGPGVTSWSSLTTLLEEGSNQDLESKALELRQRRQKPEDTRSMILQPSSSSSKLSLFKRHGGRKRKSTAVLMVESAVTETQQATVGGSLLRKSSSSSSSTSSSISASTSARRESFFRRKFFK